MKINWKVRIKNKTWLMAFAGAVLAFVYQILGMLGMAPEHLRTAWYRSLGLP